MCARLMWHILQENTSFSTKYPRGACSPDPLVGTPLSVNMAQVAGKCLFLKLYSSVDMPSDPQAVHPFRYLRLYLSYDALIVAGKRVFFQTSRGWVGDAQ